MSTRRSARLLTKNCMKSANAKMDKKCRPISSPPKRSTTTDGGSKNIAKKTKVSKINKFRPKTSLVLNNSSRPTKEKFKMTTQVVKVNRPPKFSFIVDNLLAGHGRPTRPGHVQYLCDSGFKYLVTLTQNKPTILNEYPGVGLTWVHIPIQDETPPSLEQIQEFVGLVDKAKSEKQSVSVHCAWGRGRTGTMLACYLAKSSCLAASEAIAEIRRLRPGSIDSQKQEMAVNSYVDFLKSNN